MQAAELHSDARRAFRWAVRATISIVLTLTFTTAMAFFDVEHTLWYERARLCFYFLTCYMVGGTVVATAWLRAATRPTDETPGESCS